MVLPILIGCGITAVALTVRSGLRAWEIYKRLPLFTIARMNNIYLKDTNNIEKDGRFHSSNISALKKLELQKFEGGFNSKMTEAEALLILGITPDGIEHLDESLLKKKHRMAMFSNHSDRGGSPYIAMKINEARDVLSNSIMIRKR